MTDLPTPVDDTVLSTVVGKDSLALFVRFMPISLSVTTGLLRVQDMCAGILLLLLVSWGTVIVTCISILFAIVHMTEDWVEMGEEDAVGVDDII